MTMSCINTKLIAAKLLLFTFYGGIGCLMPFLTLHMYSLGLTDYEITTINCVLPLSALIGPPTVGYLADRLGFYRFITICSVLLCALFYTLLLFVPPSPKTRNIEPFIQYRCDSSGAYLSVQSCGYQCTTKFDYIQTKFKLNDCHRVCDGPSVDQLYNPLIVENSTNSKFDDVIDDIMPPHMCLQDRDHHMQCRVINDQQYSINITRSLHKAYKQQVNETEVCIYPEGNYTSQSKHYYNMSCDTGYPHCYIQCAAYEINQNGTLLRLPKCLEKSSQLTFWMYLIIRVTADLFPAVLISLYDALILSLVKEYGGDFGRQKMFGLTSVGIFAPIAGLLMDKKLDIFKSYNFGPVFYVFDGLLLITAVLTFMLPIKYDTDRASVVKNLTLLLRNKEFALLLLIMILLGSMNGYLEIFLYQHLSSIGASHLLIGLVVTFGILPSVPFLYNSDAVVSFCGHHYLLITAFVIYSIRYIAFSYIANPWWALPLETLELFSENLMTVSAILLAYKLAPKSLLATAQGLVWISHYNIGRSIGIFVGGHLEGLYGRKGVFHQFSIYAAAAGAIYLGLYQFVKYRLSKPKCRPPIEQAKQNGALPNGNYEPLSTTTVT